MIVYIYMLCFTVLCMCSMDHSSHTGRRKQLTSSLNTRTGQESTVTIWPNTRSTPCPYPIQWTLFWLLKVIYTIVTVWLWAPTQRFQQLTMVWKDIRPLQIPVLIARIVNLQLDLSWYLSFPDGDSWFALYVLEKNGSISAYTRWLEYLSIFLLYDVSLVLLSALSSEQ